MNVTASDVDRCCINLVRVNLFHKHTNCGNIRNCIHCSHLVKMYLGNGLAVCVAFSLGNKVIYRKDIFPHFIADFKMRYYMLNLVHTAMVVMMFMTLFMRWLVMMRVMVMVMFTLFFTANRHRHMRSRYTAFHRFFSGELNVGDTEFIKLFYKFFTIGDKLKKCRCKHIACRTHSAV